MKLVTAFFLGPLLGMCLLQIDKIDKIDKNQTEIIKAIQKHHMELISK